ncbi:MAG TPA: UDP-N-acetylmuramoyl-tripeptide--D-alanyl-D-alanine ligase [Candidatus Limnocylindrales bacterium]|nr:UDP-N-acetylmuramoyl-tripeptide--D-alanyl-D-alanine ligase [Candidatus Limnocylindrales bacterium]
MTDPRRSSSAAADALTADDLVSATGGTLVRQSERPVRGAAVDSRVVRPGELFVALPGERTDGHHFARAAVEAGAAALLVTADPVDPGAWGDRGPVPPDADVTIVRVPDALRALQAVASAWRLRFRPLVVGITGSIAKTSTKEAVATVLAERLTTLKNEGNLNNEIGLPLTVLRLRPEHEAAVLEMGMYVGGEIRDLAAIGRPRIGVVTAVQAVHLSRIGTLDAIERAKGELVEALPPAADGGVAVLNADDERVVRMSARTAARAMTYGFGPGAEVRGTDVESAGLDGMAFTLDTPSGIRPARIPALGRLSVHNALAAAAVGLAAGLDLDAIVAGLSRGWAAPHRGEIRRAGGVTIVDDSYNASPGSVRAALELLGGLKGRRVAVLGEMRELGDAADRGHREVGAAAAAVCDRLVVVDGEPGGGASGIATGAVEAGIPPDRVIAVPDRAAALDALAALLAPGDVVLVKASRGIALDLLVEDLVAAMEARA